ncbi:MAG TPA: ferredoxin family protein [Planctomycetaceae bacterium]|jgi:NAD-dependent dihydropyrimidine dehydrogenase PreA subunit|nr:ferredoxin [Planctomycetaceae bacterium]HAA50258.1 ferredoxin family protein [Planctomycetaceae bacterium]HCK52021.1 ferredoxin family protein [Planctomycetaceae bacterium]|tara:strand:- start:902 stop:1918 length:1017 start_codon:yes stop_codon:yes gene_type:complete
MAAKLLTVVVSQTPSKNPAKRQLEEELVAALMIDDTVDVAVVPHLYNLDSAHSGTLFLQALQGHLVVLSWMYSRAAHWLLDRSGIKGHQVETLFDGQDEGDEDIEIPEPQGVGGVELPDRKIYCLDLGVDDDSRVYLEEIDRIGQELRADTNPTPVSLDLTDWISGSPKPEQLQRYLDPLAVLSGDVDVEPVKRRWYPVIDYERCTNCMECIDFCLFGVYGVDRMDRILVEEQDNCKKGCPACSRVCPENAIVFPQHKEPAIAGALGDVGALKIDLSRLFGSATGLDAAVAERDVELLRDGRDAVGASVGMPKRQAERDSTQRDELDDLFDGLDAMDL